MTNWGWHVSADVQRNKKKLMPAPVMKRKKKDAH